MKLVCWPGFIILAVGLRVQDFCAASSPFALLGFSVTYFHAFIIKTRRLGKPFNNKLSFTLDPFDNEVEPSRNPFRVELLHKRNLVGGRGNLLHTLEIAGLEITPKDGIPDGNDFTIGHILLTMFLVRAQHDFYTAFLIRLIDDF